MKPIDDGGPAFPHEYKYGDGTAGRADGMSLRDYFAAAAMTGSCANPSSINWTMDEIVGDSYAYADAMLAERSKP